MVEPAGDADTSGERRGLDFFFFKERSHVEGRSQQKSLKDEKKIIISRLQKLVAERGNREGHGHSIDLTCLLSNSHMSQVQQASVS